MEVALDVLWNLENVGENIDRGSKNLQTVER
jgi:hypothetical protein